MVGNDLANVLTSSPSAHSSGKSLGPLARAALKSFSLGPAGDACIRGEGCGLLVLWILKDVKARRHLSSSRWFA